MYYKLKNTLVSLSLSLSMLGVSYLVGQPPTTAKPSHAHFSTPSLATQSEAGHIAHKRSLGIKRQLSMPYFSFAPLLPRRKP